MVKVMAAAVASAVFLVLGGCNTVAGVGKDVEKVGEKTQDAAKKTSDDLKDKDKKK